MTEPATIEETASATAEEMPRTVLGVEQEYKWRIDPVDVFGTTGPTLDHLESAMPPPRRSTRELRFRHTQSTIYFDDGWQLADRRIALRATVNPGDARDVSWIGVKQTISWRDGCRDSLEVNERIDPRAIGDELRDRRTMPLDYLLGLRGRHLSPAAYAYVVQQRHKLFFRTDEGWLLQLTFDEAGFRRLPGDGDPVTTYWLEIENNTPDLRARHELNRWADSMTERLRQEPCGQAKSEVAAVMAGWKPRG